MNKKEFDDLYTEMTGRETSLLGFKRGEYAKDDKDVLINFKQVGAITQQKAAQVCMTYLMKHIQSIAMAVNHAEDLEFKWRHNGSEGLAQRFADARNYLVLLAALIREQEGECEDAEHYEEEE